MENYSNIDSSKETISITEEELLKQVREGNAVIPGYENDLKQAFADARKNAFNAMNKETIEVAKSFSTKYNEVYAPTFNHFVGDKIIDTDKQYNSNWQNSSDMEIKEIHNAAEFEAKRYLNINQVANTRNAELYEYDELSEDEMFSGLEVVADQMVQAMENGTLDTNGEAIVNSENQHNNSIHKMGFGTFSIIGICTFLASAAILVLGILFLY